MKDGGRGSQTEQLESRHHIAFPVLHFRNVEDLNALLAQTHMVPDHLLEGLNGFLKDSVL